MTFRAKVMVVLMFISAGNCCPIMVAEDLPIRRDLDYFASHLRMTQQFLHGQDNHITVLALDGELDKQCLTRSLETLFHVHPNLRVKSIEYDALSDRCFIQQELAFPDISCEFAEISEDDDWRKWLAEQISHPFPAAGPYWKVCCLTVKNAEPPRHYLLQCFDHSLCDGISTAKLQDELLTYYQALQEGKEIQKVLDIPVTSPALLYPEALQCDWQTYKQRQDQLAKTYPPLLRGATYEKMVPLDHRSTQAVLFAFNMGSLYETCKEQNKTVNDVLVAAGLLSLRDNTDIDKLDTNILTCVNLRNPKLGLADKLSVNQLSCLFNVVVHPQNVEKGAAAPAGTRMAKI